jgi:hypothetical protein
MTNKEFYNKALSESSPIKQVGWENEVKAIKRYKQIAKLVPPKTHTIVDYGCGIGNFAKYVSHSAKYIGMDTHTEFVEFANEINPELQIIPTDGKGNVPECDCLVSIGVWTLRGELDDLQYWNNIVIQVNNMVKHVTGSIIINGFHNQADYKDPKLYYHDISKWIKLANLLGLKMKVLVFEKFEFVIVLKK